MRVLSRLQSVLLFLAAALAGCSVDRAHTIPFDGTDGKGIVYSVPKTYLSITLQYSFTHDELHPGPVEAHLQGALKVAPILVPDEQSTFLIKTDSLMSNTMLLTDLNFRFGNGTLQSVDATTSDRTGEVIKELSTTAVNLAAAAAKGEGTPRQQAIQAAEKRIDDILLAIAKTASEPLDANRNGNGNGPHLPELEAELDAAQKLVSDLHTKTDPPIHVGTAPLCLLVDPDHPTKQTETYLEYRIDPPQLFAEVPPDNMDAIYVRIYDDQRRRFTDSLHGANRPQDAAGIIYRQPVMLLTKILADSGDGEQLEVFSGMLAYEQFAAPSVAVLDAKMLTSKKTSLVLDPITGGLVSYGNAQDSAIVNAAKAGGEVSKAVGEAEDAANPQPVGTGTTSSGRAHGTATAPATTRTRGTGG